MKRLFDVTMSGLALLFLAVPFFVIIVILRFTGEGKVWYFQERVGHLGHRFNVLKFVTMRVNSESTGTRDITLRNDPRVLPVGRILRASKINELPQFINVFKGDMSIVGWRPLTDRAFNCYSEEVQKQIVRCIPGLTGVGSVVFRDEEGIVSRSSKPPDQAYREDIAPYKGELELWYHEHQSFWLDIKVVVLTAWVIFSRRSRLYESWLKGLPPRLPATELQARETRELGTAGACHTAPQTHAKRPARADDIIATIRKVIGDGPVLLHGPCLEGNAGLYLQECVRTAWVSTSGAYVTQLEQMLAQFTCAKHVIATVNGTCALHVCMMLTGVERDDEVLCPSLTFVATANAISYCGAIPHFCDVEYGTMGLDATKLDKYLEQNALIRNGVCRNRMTGRRIAAMLVMHTMGHPANMASLIAVAEKWQLPVVEDAAAALGSLYRGKQVGLFGKMGALSFNSNKIITTGGGGAILTDDDSLAKRARHISSTGKLAHSWDFVHDMVAYNYRMPNINAAVGCAQMEQVSAFVRRKRALAARYQEALAATEGVSLFREPADCRSNYWLNTLWLDHADRSGRDELLLAMNNAGLQCRPIWRPMHQLPMYASCPRMEMAVTEDLANRVINIPSGSGLVAH